MRSIFQRGGAWFHRKFDSISFALMIPDYTYAKY